MKQTNEKRIKRGIAFDPPILNALIDLADKQFNGDVSRALNSILKKTLKIQEGSTLEQKPQ